MHARLRYFVKRKPPHTLWGLLRLQIAKERVRVMLANGIPVATACDFVRKSHALGIETKLPYYAKHASRHPPISPPKAALRFVSGFMVKYTFKILKEKRK